MSKYSFCTIDSFVIQWINFGTVYLLELSDTTGILWKEKKS